ncbi:MAG TPA: histidine kinase [Pyrinomonadaceae bacterium]|jgi:sensor histidine kinase YesM|nr:histidine kinase [Pyrinomonadaceae bacterium]
MMNAQMLWKRRSVRWGLIALVWMLAALIFSSQLYFFQLPTKDPISWLEAARSQFISPTLWALATPLALWLAGRFPIEQQHWRRRVPLHVLFGLLFAVVIVGIAQIIYYFIFAWGQRPYNPMGTLRTIIYNLSGDFGFYALIILLSHVFDYYRRYREGQLTAAQLQTQLAQAQLQALKMQLHPHFLFNTLHSISALLYKDTDAADKMIARLGDFLRLTLENAGTQEVTLQQELEFLKCYLEIERIRFQDRLVTRLDIDPATLDTPVPNLILQPIVENAIRHGIAPRSTMGRLDILAERIGGMLRIEIKDNGPGLPTYPNGIRQFKEGLGLANTRARLEQLYGTEHRFELANDPVGGLVVTLEIPYTR